MPIKKEHLLTLSDILCLLISSDPISSQQVGLHYHCSNPIIEYDTKSLSYEPQLNPKPGMLKKFILSDREKYQFTLTNNFLWMIPPLAWNLAWGAQNPANLGYFDGSAPQGLLIAQSIFRVAAISYPILLPIEAKGRNFKTGLILYLAGSILYYSSWTYIMNHPESSLSQTAMMRFAPVYTPLIWLSGVSLMSNSKIHFSLSVMFISLHMAEYISRY